MDDSDLTFKSFSWEPNGKKVLCPKSKWTSLYFHNNWVIDNWFATMWTLNQPVPKALLHKGQVLITKPTFMHPYILPCCLLVLHTKVTGLHSPYAITRSFLNFELRSYLFVNCDAYPLRFLNPSHIQTRSIPIKFSSFGYVGCCRKILSVGILLKHL